MCIIRTNTISFQIHYKLKSQWTNQSIGCNPFNFFVVFFFVVCTHNLSCCVSITTEILPLVQVHWCVFGNWSLVTRFEHNIDGQRQRDKTFIEFEIMIIWVVFVYYWSLQFKKNDTPNAMHEINQSHNGRPYLILFNFSPSTSSVWDWCPRDMDNTRIRHARSRCTQTDTARTQTYTHTRCTHMRHQH